MSEANISRTSLNSFELQLQQFAGHHVVWVLNRHWTRAYVEELCSFPNGVHDDQVDASSGAWAMASEDDDGIKLTFTEWR